MGSRSLLIGLLFSSALSTSPASAAAPGAPSRRAAVALRKALRNVPPLAEVAAKLDRLSSSIRLDAARQHAQALIASGNALYGGRLQFEDGGYAVGLEPTSLGATTARIDVHEGNKPGAAFSYRFDAFRYPWSLGGRPAKDAPLTYDHSFVEEGGVRLRQEPGKQTLSLRTWPARFPGMIEYEFERSEAGAPRLTKVAAQLRSGAMRIETSEAGSRVRLRDAAGMDTEHVHEGPAWSLAR